MDYRTLVRSRRMVRAYRADDVDPDALDRILDAARRAPSAGNTAALDLVVLQGADQTAAYWDTTLPAERRSDFAWPDLLAAPVIVLVVTSPDAYVERYREPDKAASGLGTGVDAWPVPFWFVDGGAALMALLLGAVDEGLGALLFGLFDHEAAVRARFGIPADRRVVAAVAIGHRADNDRPSESAGRGRRAQIEMVHYGRW